MNRDETGKDGTLIVNGEEFPFTNQSLTISWDTSDSDYNDKTETHHRKTAKSTEGEIEVDGSAAELKAAIMDENGEQRDDIRIQMSGSEGGDRLTGVTVTEFGREYPGGDATTTTISVVANSHRPINLGS
jgi:hypothetical protein